MDTAYCTNGKTYAAKFFARMPEAERASLRGKLECEHCGADAIFRKESILKQKAHFAARHHDHCRLVVEERAQGQTVKNSRGLSGSKLADRIVIRTSKTEKEEKTEHAGQQNAGDVRYATSEGGSSRTNKSSKLLGPASILSALIHEPDFSLSNCMISYADFPELPASKFFVALDDSNIDTMLGERRGFWGEVVTVASGPSGLWLNNRGSDGPSAWIPVNLASEARERFKLQDGAGQRLIILALGELDRSPRTKFIKITDLTCLAVVRD